MVNLRMRIKTEKNFSAENSYSQISKAQAFKNSLLLNSIDKWKERKKMENSCNNCKWFIDSMDVKKKGCNRSSEKRFNTHNWFLKHKFGKCDSFNNFALFQKK